MPNSLTPPHVNRTTTYLIAILSLVTLAVCAVVAFSIVGLDENSTPLAVSAIGFISTVVTALLVLLRLENVNTNVNGHLSKLSASNERLHERLTAQAGDTLQP